MEMPSMKRYSTDKQIQERYHFSPTSLWRKRRTDPRFPKPFRLHDGGPHLTADDELDRYDEQLKQDSSQPQSEGAGA